MNAIYIFKKFIFQELKNSLKHIPGNIGVAIISFCALIALFAYFVAPDSSPNANSMHLELTTKRPGAEVDFIKLKRLKIEEASLIDRLLYGEEKAYKTMPISSVRLEDELLYYVPFGYSQEYEKVLQVDKLFSKDDYLETKTFYLGTDKYGRDLLSRIIIASRISLAVGLISVFLSLIIGITLGLLAGYYGSWVDRCISWLINVVWSIPTLLMVIAISLALGKGIWQVFIAVGLTMWVEVARVVRGQVLSLSKMEYIQAAKVLGFGDFRIMFKHILPNIISPIIVISAANFASAILIEAGLSFLGIGAQAPTPSWGAMIKDHYSYIILDKAYLAVAPGMAIMLLVLAFMLLGNMLRDKWDVRA